MHRSTPHPDPEEYQETRELVTSAFSLARSLGYFGGDSREC